MLCSAITNSIHQVDSEVPLLNIKTMDDSVAESLSSQRFTMLLLAAFAGLALLLAAVGIYSVLAYAVRRRVREIGIRMALGAQISDVLRMVVLEGMKPTLLGVLIGLVGALALGTSAVERDLRRERSRPGNLQHRGRADDRRRIAGQHAARLSRDQSRSDEDAAGRIGSNRLPYP